jgi:hypothetical protein
MNLALTSDQRRKQQQLIFIAYVVAAIALVVASLEQHLIKPRQCVRTSILTGRRYLNELLNGHPRRFQEVLFMKKDTFQRLCLLLSGVGLRDTLNVQIDEQVAIFLFITRHNASNRATQEQFQHSGETISRYVSVAYFTDIIAISQEFWQQSYVSVLE